MKSKKKKKKRESIASIDKDQRKIIAIRIKEFVEDA